MLLLAWFLVTPRFLFYRVAIPLNPNVIRISNLYKIALWTRNPKSIGRPSNHAQIIDQSPIGVSIGCWSAWFLAKIMLEIFSSTGWPSVSVDLMPWDPSSSRNPPPLDRHSWMLLLGHGVGGPSMTNGGGDCDRRQRTEDGENGEWQRRGKMMSRGRHG